MWEDDVKSDVANLRITNGRTASETGPNGKNSLRRPKLPRSCSALRRRRRIAKIIKHSVLYVC